VSPALHVYQTRCTIKRTPKSHSAEDTKYGLVYYCYFHTTVEQCRSGDLFAGIV